MNDLLLLLIGWGLGLLTSGIAWLVAKLRNQADAAKIHAFLTEEYTGQDGRPSFASTEMIAARCKIPPEKVRQLCYDDDRLRPSVGEGNDAWGLLSVIGPAKVRKKLRPGFLGEPLPPGR